MQQITNTNVYTLPPILKLGNEEQLPANYTGIVQRQNHKIWYYADSVCESVWDADSGTEEEATWDEAWYYKSILHRTYGTAYKLDFHKLWCLLNKSITDNTVILIIT